jgi:hypothetical protein
MRYDMPFTIPSRHSLALLATACCIAALAFGNATPAHAAKATVTVSKPATSLPGPTYTWVAAQQKLEVEADARVQDAQFRAQLQSALDKALQAKGYRPAPAGARPDFVLAYRIGVRDLEEATLKQQPAPETNRGAVRCTREGCSQIVSLDGTGDLVPKLETKKLTEGGLLIEVLEPGSINVLWRALNRGTIKPGKVSRKRLEAVATETLARLPAAGKTP